MIEVGQDRRLAIEAGAGDGVDERPAGEDLDRHFFAGGLLLRLVDRGLAAGAHLAQRREAWEGGEGDVWRERRIVAGRADRRVDLGGGDERQGLFDRASLLRRAVRLLEHRQALELFGELGHQLRVRRDHLGIGNDLPAGAPRADVGDHLRERRRRAAV